MVMCESREAAVLREKHKDLTGHIKKTAKHCKSPKYLIIKQINRK